MVALAHGAGGANNSPYRKAAAEGHEGLFAKTAPYFVNCVFVVEVASVNVSNEGLSGCTMSMQPEHGSYSRILVKGRRKGRTVGRAKGHGGRDM